jgi:hypothetical protein
MDSDPIHDEASSSNRLRELIDNASTLVGGQMATHEKGF